MHFSKMSGRIFVWTNLFICVFANLGDWTAVGLGVAAQHQDIHRQDEYQSRNFGETINTADDHNGPTIGSSAEGDEEEETPPKRRNEEEGPPTDRDDTKVNDPPLPSIHRTGVEIGDAETDGSEVARRYNFDKRGPSSYKLKYGGLGKRKVGSNSFRYGGLGKRLNGDEREPQEREFDNGKNLLETAYYFLSKPYPSGIRSDEVAADDFLEPIETAHDTPADNPELQVLAAREQRSRMGPGMRYAGLGKRRLKM